jgi:hypothetical protein
VTSQLKPVKILLLVFCVAAISNATRADDRMPPPGIPVPENIRRELESGAAKLGRDIEEMRTALKAKPDLLELLPDVQIYHNAVRYALEDDLFYKTNDFALARKLLKEGEARAKSLREGSAP